MTPLEALKLGRDALAEALNTHIYNAEDGEFPDADCRYAEAVAVMDKAIAEASPKPAPPRYPSPSWRDHLNPGMRECTAFEYYEVRPAIERHGDVQSFTSETAFINTFNVLVRKGVPHKAYWTLYGRYDQGHGETLAMAIGDFTTKEDAFEVMNAILAVPAAAMHTLDAGSATNIQRITLNRHVADASSLLEDMIMQSSNGERL